MKIRQRISVPSFVAGLATATVLAGIPAVAVVSMAADPNPDVYDGTAPALTLKPLQFVVGASLDAAGPVSDDCGSASWNNDVPLLMRWSAADTTSGVATYDVWRQAPGLLGKVVSGTTGTRHRLVGTNYDGSCGGGSSTEGNYWVVAHDNRGNSATSSARPRYVRVWQETGADLFDVAEVPVARKRAWRTSTCTCYNNGRTLYSTAKGASLTYTITTTEPGQTVAVVAEKNTNRGKMKIRLDGTRASTVNTYAATPTHRVVVWQKVIRRPGTHTVRVKNVGTSARPRVDVDAIMLTTGGWWPPPEIDDVIADE